MGISARAKRTDVQLVQRSNVFQERLGVRTEFGMIPGGLRPQLEMVSILTEKQRDTEKSIRISLMVAW